MKKLSAILSLILVVCMLAGCAGSPVIYYSDCTCPADAHVQTPENQATQPPVEAEGAVKTGLALVTSVADSVAGEAKYDVTVAAVNVDENGVILACYIDSIGTSVKFGTDGVITSDVAAEVLTKNELGDNYNMKLYGGATYEWYEQAAALAQYAVGKTVEELKAGAVNESGKAADADLATTATIYLGGYVAAIEKAVANAQVLGAQAGDELKVAVLASLADSKSADAENAGNAQLNVDAAVLNMNGETITACVLDSVQAKVAFDATGVITSDVTAAVQTKTELGEGYGMKAWGGATFEWNEQAANFAAYVTGKTVAEVQGIAIDEATKPTDADLAASVTIAIGGFQALIAKAAEVQSAAVKTGLAVVTSVADSVDGEAKYDVTVAAVNVDENGVILACYIDSIGASVKFGTDGVITSDVAAEVLTKNELGDNYNMKLYGGATYEWYEQAAALAQYAVGKTVEELKAGAVNESGKAADADLATTATIYLGGYVAAIEKAVANAQVLGAQAGDELKVAVLASLADSKSADAENAGNAQLNVDAVVLNMNGETITACVLDSVQAKVSFDAAGVITSDITAPVQTKTELGEGYGMKAWGGAKYEWNEQAANFAAYVTGKTVAEIQGIAIDEATKPTDADLATSVTISIGGFQALIAKAAQ